MEENVVQEVIKVLEAEGIATLDYKPTHSCLRRSVPEYCWSPSGYVPLRVTRERNPKFSETVEKNGKEEGGGEEEDDDGGCSCRGVWPMHILVRYVHRLKSSWSLPVFRVTLPPAPILLL